MKNYKNIIALVATGLACTAITSNATLTDYGAVGLISTAGASQFNSGSFATTPTSSFSGVFNSWVVANDTVASGHGFTGETFVFQANINPTDVLQAMTINGFGGITPLGIGYNTSGGGAGYSFVNQASIGGQINLNFGNGYNGTGGFMYVFTDFTAPGTLVLDGVQDHLNAVVEGFTPVPEPTTVLAGALMLLPLGVSTMRILGCRKTT